MISDNQRRDYARNIRQFLSRPGIERAWDNDPLQTVGRLIETSVGENIIARLADLIDRPTCHDSADFDRESFRCSNCGYRIVSLTPGRADASVLVSPEGLIADWGYCPHCGAEAVPNE